MTPGILKCHLCRTKEDLEKTAGILNKLLSDLGGEVFVSVNKALVTRASSVIPVVPLYISLLYKIMKEKGIHEGCIEQMYRMPASKVYGSDGTQRGDVQNEVVRCGCQLPLKTSKV